MTRIFASTTIRSPSARQTPHTTTYAGRTTWARSPATTRTSPPGSSPTSSPNSRKDGRPNFRRPGRGRPCATLPRPALRAAGGNSTPARASRARNGIDGKPNVVRARADALARLGARNKDLSRQRRADRAGGFPSPHAKLDWPVIGRPRLDLDARAGNDPELGEMAELARIP